MRLFFTLLVSQREAPKVSECSPVYRRMWTDDDRRRKHGVRILHPLRGGSALDSGLHGGPLMNYHCPLCGHLSDLVFNPEQAFCTNDDCPCVTFNPSLPDGGLSKVKKIEWKTIPFPEGHSE